MKIMEEKKIIQDNNINEIEKNSDEAFLLYEKAFDTFDVKKKRTYLKKALALSPLDIDIKLALLETEKNITLVDYERLEADSLNQINLDDANGEAWLNLSLRPYIRVLRSKLKYLVSSEKYEEALDTAKKLLQLEKSHIADVGNIALSLAFLLNDARYLEYLYQTYFKNNNCLDGLLGNLLYSAYWKSDNEIVSIMNDICKDNLYIFLIISGIFDLNYEYKNKYYFLIDKSLTEAIYALEPFIFAIQSDEFCELVNPALFDSIIQKYYCYSTEEIEIGFFLEDYIDFTRKKLINVLLGKTKKYENSKISGMYKDTDMETIQDLIDKMIFKHVLLKFDQNIVVSPLFIVLAEILEKEEE